MKNLLLFVPILFSAIYGESQWTQTNGPGGASIEFLAKSTSAIFAVTERHGVFRSIDSGENWSSIQITGLQNEYITGIASNDFKVFAVAGGSIFRSTDNGINWVKTCDSIGENINIRALKASKNYLFALSLDKGVFRSSDGGVSWIAVNNGIDSIYSITSIAMAGDTIFAGGSKDVDSGHKHAVYRSLDNGISWSPFDSGFPDETSIYRLTISSSRIIASTNKGLYISSDNSGNWEVFNTSFLRGDTSTAKVNYADYIRMAAEGDLLLATQINFSEKNVFLSTNKGSEWSTIGSTLPLNLMKDCMLNKNAIFISTHCGIFRSTDNGQTWVSANSGIKGTQISSLVDNKKSIFTSTYGSGVFVSVDNGANWSEFNSNLTTLDISSIVIKDSLIYACSPGYGIFRSSINDCSWVKVYASLPTNSMWHLAVHDGKLFSSRDNGLYFSKDNGVTWMLVNDSPVGTNAIVTFATCDSILFAGGTTGLFYYNPESNTLSKVSSGPANEVINCLASSGNLIFAGTATNGCYISMDKGRNWQKSSLPYKVRPNNSPDGYEVAPVTSLSLNGKVTVASLPGPDMFVPNGGCYFSVDSGKSWTSLGPDTSWHTSILKLLTRGDTLLAGTFNRSIWMRTLPKVSETAIGSSKPELNQILPSALQLSVHANAGLTIAYTLSKSTNVSITIHTLNGSLVTSLVKTRQSAGSYHCNWNFGTASGLYIVCLKTDGRILSRTVMLTP